MQTTETTNNMQLATKPQNQVAKLPIAHSLPESLVKTLPRQTIARISQLTLKQSSDEDRQKFAHQVLEFINPKFEDEQEALYSQKIIVEFAQNCNLTASEYLLALDMASKRQLSIDGEPVKVFREIDRLKLGEIETAYLEFIQNDKQHDLATKKINEYLNPPKEETAEEKQEKRLIFLKNSFKEYLQTGEMKGVILFYDKIRNLYPKISIDFVEHFLIKFKAEEPQKSESVGGMMPYKMVKNDAFVKFKETYVYTFLEKMEMKNYTEQQWIDYWEN